MISSFFRESLRVLLGGSGIDVDKLQPPASEIAHSYDAVKDVFTATMPNGTEIQVNYGKQPHVAALLTTLR